MVREEIAQQPADHINIVLFLESTTSGGTSVHPFFPRLMAAAIETKTPIQPVSLRYLNDNQISNIAPFTNDQSLLNHAFHLMKQKSTNTVICFGEPIVRHKGRTVATLLNKHTP